VVFVYVFNELFLFQISNEDAHSVDASTMFHNDERKLKNEFSSVRDHFTKLKMHQLDGWFDTTFGVVWLYCITL